MTNHDREAGRTCFCAGCVALQGPDVTPWPVRAAFALGLLASVGFVVWFLVALRRAHAGVR